MQHADPLMILWILNKFLIFNLYLSFPLASMLILSNQIQRESLWSKQAFLVHLIFFLLVHFELIWNCLRILFCSYFFLWFLILVDIWVAGSLLSYKETALRLVHHNASVFAWKNRLRLNLGEIWRLLMIFKPRLEVIKSSRLSLYLRSSWGFEFIFFCLLSHLGVLFWCNFCDLIIYNRIGSS